MGSRYDTLMGLIKGGVDHGMQAGSAAVLQNMKHGQSLEELIRGKELDQANEAAKITNTANAEKGTRDDIQGRMDAYTKAHPLAKVTLAKEGMSVDPELVALMKAQHDSTKAPKALGSEEQRNQMLSEEGLEATGRLKSNTEAHPNATKAIQIAEQLGQVPVVGGGLQALLGGATKLFSSAASEIDADREKVARNMGYLKSGANVNADEVRGIRRQMPGVATGGGGLYDEYSAPFQKTLNMHMGRPGAEGGAAALQAGSGQGGNPLALPTHGSNSGQGTAQAGQGRVAVKQQRNAATGKIRTVYSDGTFEVH